MDKAKLSFHNEKNKSPDEIAEEMNSVWKKYRANKFEKLPESAREPPMDEFFNKIREEHKDLYSAYPTVMRHMCQEGIYDSKVFEKYLVKLKNAPWINDTTRMDSYTDYYVMLYKHYNAKTYTATTVANVRQNYRRMLQEEHDEFKQLYEKHSQVLEEKEKVYKMERGLELLNAFDRLAESRKLKPEMIKEVKSSFLSGKIDETAIEAINMKLLETPAVQVTEESN